MLHSVRKSIAKAVEKGWLLWLPIFLILLWHLRNQGWPNDDAAQYMNTAYDIFDRFRNNGLIAGLAAVLDLRGWRPIVFPTLAVPYLLLFHGNIVSAAAAVCLTLYCLFTFAVHSLCGLFLKRAQATVAAAVVVTAPLLCQFATIFFSEFAWVCFATTFLCCTLRSDGFRLASLSGTAGVFLGLVVVTRPAESVAFMAFPVGILIGCAMYRRSIGLRDLALSGILIVVSGGLLLGSLVVPALTRGWIWLAYFLSAVPCLAIAGRSRGRLSVGLASFWGAACTVSVVWWAGFVRPLYEWTQTTSIGYMARVTAPPRHSHMSPLAMAAEIAAYYGAFPICSLIVLALVSAVARLHSQHIQHSPFRSAPAERNSCPVRLLVCVALGALLPVFALYWSSGTGDPRRAMVGITLLLIALTVVALSAAGSVARVNTALVSAIAVFQLCLLVPGSIGGRLPNFRLIDWSGAALRQPREERDLNAQTLDILEAKLPPNSAVAVYTMALFSSANRVYEPAALRLGAAIRHHSLEIGYLWDEERYDVAMRRLAGLGYRYLLLDSFDDAQVRKSHMPYVHFDAAMLDILRKPNPDLPGLRLMEEFPLAGRTQWLFEITDSARTLGIPPDPNLIAFEGNLAAARNGARPVASSHQGGFSVDFINDDRASTAWGAAEGAEDVYAGVVLSHPHAVGQVRLVLFSPTNRSHLRDVSVVCSDSETISTAEWHVVRSRLAGQSNFAEKITVPPLPDQSVVDIEVDPNDPNGGVHRVWGFACLSSSRGYHRNYLPSGTGVYVRELQMRERKAAGSPSGKRGVY